MNFWVSSRYCAAVIGLAFAACIVFFGTRLSNQEIVLSCLGKQSKDVRGNIDLQGLQPAQMEEVCAKHFNRTVTVEELRCPDPVVETKLIVTTAAPDEQHASSSSDDAEASASSSSRDPNMVYSNDLIIPLFRDDPPPYSTVARNCPELKAPKGDRLPLPHRSHCALPRFGGVAPYRRTTFKDDVFWWRHVYDGSQPGKNGHCNWQGRKSLVTYAVGEHRIQQMHRLEESAKRFGIDNVMSYTGDSWRSMAPPRFHDILSGEGHGSGQWVWKPIVINHALQQLEEGEVLMWSDSDSYFTADPTPYYCVADKQSVLPFFNGVQSNMCTSRDLFIAMGADTMDFAETLMVCTGYFFIKNNDLGRKAMQYWMEVLLERPNLWAAGRGESKTGQEYFEYQQDQYNNMADQSVWSVVTQLFGFKALPVPTLASWNILPETVLRCRREEGLPEQHIMIHGDGCGFGATFYNPDLFDCSYDQWLSVRNMGNGGL